MEIGPARLQQRQRLHELRKAAIGLEPARGIRHDLGILRNVAQCDGRAGWCEIARVHAVVDHGELGAQLRRELVALEGGRAHAAIATRQLQQDAGIARADAQGLVLADRLRIEIVGIGVARAIVPFEIAQQRHARKGVLEVEAGAEPGMGADHVGPETAAREIRRRAVGGLAEQHRGFETLQVVMRAGRSRACRLHTDRADRRIVVLAFGVNEHDLVATLGRERARDVRVLTRKELVDEEHAHAPVPCRSLKFETNPPYRAKFREQAPYDFPRTVTRD